MRIMGAEIINSKNLQNKVLNKKLLKVIYSPGYETDFNETESFLNYSKENNHIFNVEQGDLCICQKDTCWLRKLSPEYVLLFEDDIEIESELYNIYNITEASLLWGKQQSTIRKAIKSNKFIEGIEYRKSGRIVLITRKAMERVYGK